MFLLCNFKKEEALYSRASSLLILNIFKQCKCLFVFKFPALFTCHTIELITSNSSEKREEIKSRADFLPHHNSLVAAVFVYKQYSHHKTGKDHNSFKVYETDII